MSKKIAVFGLLVALGLTLGLARLSHATDVSPLPKSQLDNIRSTCVESQSILRQIRSSDTLLRVNQGQRYEQMASRLMAPMNSRIALNQFDGQDLLSTTSDYGKTLSSFRDKFRSYDKEISKAIGIDCRENPQEYYYAVAEAREDRSDLHETVVELNGLLKQYRKQFESFADSLEKQMEEKS